MCFHTQDFPLMIFERISDLTGGNKKPAGEQVLPVGIQMPYGMKTEVMSPTSQLFICDPEGSFFVPKNFFSRGELTDRDQIWDPY